VSRLLCLARGGRELPSGPFEGVPTHLGPRLSEWLADQLEYETALNDLILVARISVPGRSHEQRLARLVDWARDPEQFLDVLHAHIRVNLAPNDGWIPILNALLDQGGSVFHATPDGLLRRVEPAAQSSYDAATSPEDPISRELRQAWAKAYGRDPDPSDAWDHAIKAVESVLIPIVVPNNSKATLSNVIGELRSQSDRWQLAVRGMSRDHAVSPLVQMLSLIWPDPNRHGAATPEPPATIEEVRAVVHLAVTIVQWGRAGSIAKRSSQET
jgi:hypothetical protein